MPILFLLASLCGWLVGVFWINSWIVSDGILFGHG
jgi:hypothetical protein